MKVYSKVFSTSLDSMETIIKWLLEKIDSKFFEKSSQYNFELGIEEVMVNLLKHGYKDQPMPFFVRLEISANEILLSLKDYAPKFNLLDHQIDTCCTDLEEIKIGGHGIRIIKQAFKDITYSYENSFNSLTIKLKL